MKRRWRGPSAKSSIVGCFKNSRKNIGTKSKLSGREEFLLYLMKIRLGLLHEDLSNRFSTSKTLATRICSTWFKATAAALKSLFTYQKWKIMWPVDLKNLVNSQDYIQLLMPLRFFYKHLNIIKHNELLGQTTKTIIL